MKLVKTFMAVCITLIVAMPAAAVERNPYFGLGAGISKLSPDVGNSGLTLDKDTSTVASLMLGVPITERFNAELGYSQLGDAELSNQDVGYSAFSLGAVAYVVGNDARLHNESGLRAYLRLGFNIMDNETDLPLKESDNTALWVGAGLEWPLSTRLTLRVELSSFDGDAQAVTVAVLFQPGAGSPHDQVSVQAPEPVIQPQPLPLPEPAIQPLPKPEVAPIPEPTPTVTPMPRSGVLAGVQFEPGTATLTSIGKSVVERLAVSMQAYPNLSVEIGAHTDGLNGDANKLALTRGRAIAVARQLAANGVPIRRLKARSYGANKPRAQGDSAGARRLNNRIEIVVRR